MELHTAKEEILKKMMNGIGVSSVASHFESIIGQGMDEYSRLVAIEFGKWAAKNGWSTNGNDTWENWDCDDQHTTDMVFDLFIKEYGK